ncbi:MAG: DUF2550 domain-containing protein [Propionibacteriaceae bacterium]|nr:DUF2550 domain-containing protein [Propionibacteriaceae bacterium]
MGWLGDVEWFVIVIAVLVVLACASLFVRRRLLSSNGGVFDCGMRVWKDNQPTSWTMGMARYHKDVFQWFRAFSLVPRPSVQLPREAIRITQRRNADDLEALVLFDDHLVICVEEDDQERRDLSMTPQSLTGLLSWLEAAPPGGASYHATV